MTTFIQDPLSYNSSPYTTEALEQVTDKYSKLLDSKGKPLVYKRQKLGFDLSKKVTYNTASSISTGSDPAVKNKG